MPDAGHLDTQGHPCGRTWNPFEHHTGQCRSPESLERRRLSCDAYYMKYASVGPDGTWANGLLIKKSRQRWAASAARATARLNGEDMTSATDEETARAFLSSDMDALDLKDEIFAARLAMYADPDYWAGKASGNGPIPLKDDPGLHGKNPATVAQKLAQDLIDVLTWQEAY